MSSHERRLIFGTVVIIVFGLIVALGFTSEWHEEYHGEVVAIKYSESGGNWFSHIYLDGELQPIKATGKIKLEIGKTYKLALEGPQVDNPPFMRTKLYGWVVDAERLDEGGTQINDE